jgi:hypothetical protein
MRERARIPRILSASAPAFAEVTGQDETGVRFSRGNDSAESIG